jgi:phosphoribosyl 1,2-cyclic phosphate phosphodiesterase
MHKGLLQLLGTGASSGIPVIACKCSVCTSQNPKNRRLRTSALVQYRNKSFLIDVGPDIRLQALQYGIDHVDGLLVSHTHYDHIGGLEELRIFNFLQQRPIDCLISPEGYSDLQKLFFYIFNPRKEDMTYSSSFNFHVAKSHEGQETICELPIRYFRFMQGAFPVLGFRFGDMAYLTDIKSYSKEIFEFLKGTKTLVISALRFTPSIFHFSIDEACDFARIAGAEKTYIVHIAHEIEHEAVQSLLPKDVFLGHDGQELEFTV